jgi:hypothetical protein
MKESNKQRVEKSRFQRKRVDPKTRTEKNFKDTNEKQFPNVKNSQEIQEYFFSKKSK